MHYTKQLSEIVDLLDKASLPLTQAQMKLATMNHLGSREADKIRAKLTILRHRIKEDSNGTKTHQG